MCFGFDSAGSNLLAVRWFAKLIMDGVPDNIILHPEPCLTHLVHRINSDLVSAGQFASSIYSTSKLMRLCSSISGIRQGLIQHVSSNIELQFSDVP